MEDPDYINYDELRRLIDQDEADNHDNPWRVESIQREPPPPPKESLGRRAQWTGPQWPIAPAAFCHRCKKLSLSCSCTPYFR